MQSLTVSPEAFRRALGIAFTALLMLLALLYLVERQPHHTPKHPPTSPVTLKIALRAAPTAKAGVFVGRKKKPHSGAFASIVGIQTELRPDYRDNLMPVAKAPLVRFDCTSCGKQYWRILDLKPVICPECKKQLHPAPPQGQSLAAKRRP